jgi:hypothetical protein
VETFHEEQMFFDPFAEEGEEFKPLEAFDTIRERYENKEVEHDYTADQFVSDVEALMLDSTFMERFEEAEAIAARMHEMCVGDHAVQESMLGSEVFGSHGEDDGHGHKKIETHKKCSKCEKYSCECKK